MKDDELEEDYWQDKYRNWADGGYGMNFYNSKNINERLVYARWVKKLGKKFKEQNNIKAMMLAYKILKDYQIYPVKDNEMINTKDAF